MKSGAEDLADLLDLLTKLSEPGWTKQSGDSMVLSALKLIAGILAKGMKDVQEKEKA